MANKLNLGRYDYATFSCFETYAMSSMVIPMCLVPLAIDLGFPLGDGGMSLGGALQLGRSIMMVAAMLLSGFAAAKWGKRITLGYSVILMSVSIMACSFSPAYGILLAALMLAGLGEGLLEGLLTPFVQDLHPDESGRYMNLSHGFWSVGVLVLVLAAGALLDAGVSWRTIVLVCGVISLAPAFLYLLPDSSVHEQVFEEKADMREVTRRTWELMKIPRFWLFFAAMFFAGGGEFGLTFWCASYIQLEFVASPWAAGAGTACFAAGMVVGRMTSGYLVHQRNLKALIVGMAAFATGSCLLFPWIQSLWLLFALLFFSGIAAGPFWPSIQSDGASRISGDLGIYLANTPTIP